MLSEGKTKTPVVWSFSSSLPGPGGECPWCSTGLSLEMRKPALPFGNTVESGWSPEQMCIVDMGTAVPRTPMPQTHGNGKAILWSTHMLTVYTESMPCSFLFLDLQLLPLPTVYNEPASSTQMHRINTLSFPASECAAPSEYMTYPIPAFPHTCLSFITPSLPQSGQSCASLGRSFVPVRCGGTQTGPCRSSSKRRLWVIDPRYGDIMGVCHLSGQGTPAGWSSVSNSGLLASVPSVFSFYSLILIT